ncbi:MAG TPA: hypothetical protein VJS69_08725 [Candidatus Krumholzibacteria bacterium]|nr:hypothetical protein [Candidatus Krumholzibacteria bacterium]
MACALLGLCLGACDHASPTDPVPPSGGQTYVLSYDKFSANVEPVLASLGCDNMNCHGGGIRGTFQLSPPNDKNAHYDFTQACMQVTGSDPKDSPLVLKPLAAECGGATHGGGSFFFSLDDPNYMAMLQWAESGSFK